MGEKSPRRGSLAYWHRARAKRLVPRIRSWHHAGEGLAGFAAYKAGMQSVLMVDDSGAPTSGQEITAPATVLEAPPLFVYAIIAYKQTPFGLKTVKQASALQSPKQLTRVLTRAKKNAVSADQLNAQEYSEFRVLACTQPWKTGVGKKTPEVMEIALQGNAQQQLEYAKSVLGKELRINEVLKPGEYVDAIAITKGHGWQGVVKRFGVSLNPRKASKARRHGGSIGGEKQAKVMYTVPRAGQRGFHKRTDENKRVLAIGEASGLAREFKHYGRLKADFVIVKGSVPGPAKRFVALRKSLQAKQVKQPVLLQRG